VKETLYKAAVSIPRSGFCSFKLFWIYSEIRLITVSIPRSGFCSFKPGTPGHPTSGRDSFNPSVGILFIQAPAAGTWIISPALFQSLGRDSVHSSSSFNYLPPGAGQVSIPRSGFCSFKRGIADMPVAQLATFQSLGRDSVHSSY